MRKIVPKDAILVPDQAKRVFQGMIFDVYQWPEKFFDGTPHTFEMTKRPDTVVAICIVDDKILVIEDEQPHRGTRTTLPGGRVDPEDSDPLTAAKREIIEETGYSFANWKLIDVTQRETKIEWFVHLYVAWDVTNQAQPSPEPGEKITLNPKTLEQIKQLLSQKNILTDSRHIFEKSNTIDDLKNLPEFQGKIVDR